MSHNSWLVLMDTDQVQSYIFATNRLKEIRGASLLLESLNRQTSRTLLGAEGRSGEEIFVGGGGILATFPTESEARTYMKAVTSAYRQQTHIASITGVAVPVSDDEQETLQHARLQLRLAKENPAGIPFPAAHGTGELAPARPFLTSPYFRLCQSCNSYPATAYLDGDEICAACAAKRQEASRLFPAFPAYSGYARFARRMAKDISEPPDERWLTLTKLPAKLDELAGASTGYIGFIHADVNGLGSFLEQQGNLQAIREIGVQVEDALENALATAVREIGLAPRMVTSEWPFLITILGGDDVTLIVPAGQAVPLANALCLAFEKQIKTVLGETTNEHNEMVGQLALSAGVVISKPKHPAYALAELAEDLTRSAKRLSHELKTGGWGAVPTLDFRVIQTPTANPVDIVRQEEYFDRRGGQEYWYTSRPLPCRALDGRPGVNMLLETITSLRLSNFPHNKLAQWADLIYADELEQILGWQMLQTRVTGEARQALLQLIANFDLTREQLFAQSDGTGTPYQTPLLDIIELYEFAGRRGHD